MNALDDNRLLDSQTPHQALYQRLMRSAQGDNEHFVAQMLASYIAGRGGASAATGA